MSLSETNAIVVHAPTRPALRDDANSVFLAGTTSSTDQQDWRELLTRSLAHLPITIFNPYRDDWDSSWKEDVSDSRFVEQVTWELDMQERASVVVVYFHPSSQAPVSLLEFGLCARSAKAIVVCPQGYWKRGNVQLVCLRLGITFLNTVEELAATLISQFGQ
ncbi:hypothetical protein B0T11DRAFT_139804 [Plectosphaerella cucumerina]|uniref:Nucleoside 2-deoxyribosyltransferase-like protein n=1 Tax=Plectosphaerella cucumerina TaxID=40658 RepID=A0A8K0T6N2_9PEZI|nr:hypothetical protein B0T11DRAFT_139804 [Plectosphaerella cucumerina]